MFLPTCVDAGFEMGASFFMILHWWKNPGYEWVERIIGPIPDYLQMIASVYYMYSCIIKENIRDAHLIVNWLKYI
jgi:hypothetical protein